MMKKYNAARNMKKLICRNIGNAVKFSQKPGTDNQKLTNKRANAEDENDQPLANMEFTSRIVREMIL